MSDYTLIIRKIEEKDYEFVLSINEENVEVLAPMNQEKLEKFVELAERFLIAEVDGKQAAFMIVLREGVESYDSENYRWFSKHYEKFLYVDRIVIDEPYRGMGLGRTLYQNLFEYGKASNVPFVTAEIDTIPYNETSLKFHETMGFKEVGVQFVRNNTIKVSLQEAKGDYEVDHGFK